MQDVEIVENIFQEIRRKPLEFEQYSSAFRLIQEILKSDKKSACELSARLRDLLDYPLQSAKSRVKDFYNLRNRTLLLESPYVFDSYIQYLEINRPVKERLYMPTRRKVLKQVVDLFQKLADKELDEIFICMPPRTGKTTIATLFITWIIGRNSDLSNLYSSYSDGITKSFYKGILQIITDPDTYNWNVIFPEAKVVEQNGDIETININVKKKYASLTCRSIDGTLNGACDCGGFLVADDLVSGIEEAMNPERLANKMQKVLNDLLTRAKPTTGIAWIGTRWSLKDPIGVRLDMLENDASFKNVKWEILNIPALDENGESNFDYLYGKGFDTEYFIQRRAEFEKAFDMESWSAQYMGEPIEREGALFKPEQLKYYNGVLPEGTPDRVFMAVDVALGGGDYLSAPICAQYGEEIYIVDWIFDKSEKNITRPRIVDAIKKYNIKNVNFERNNGGGEYADYIEEMLKTEGIKIHITATSAPTGLKKEVRIHDTADDIRTNFVFLEGGKRNRDYALAMQNLFSFKDEGKNKHDDAPDSLTQAWAMVNTTLFADKFVIFKRPF